MSKVLFTGLIGFVGSWLAMLLYSKGYKVYGISLSNKNPLHIYNKCKISKISKSKKKFKYTRSNINIDLIKTNEWYLNSFKKSDMSEITLQQINDYLN